MSAKASRARTMTSTETMYRLKHPERPRTKDPTVTGAYQDLTGAYQDFRTLFHKAMVLLRLWSAAARSGWARRPETVEWKEPSVSGDTGGLASICGSEATGKDPD